MERRIAEIDRLIPSPEQRAQEVYNAIKQTLPDKTNWDVICFCINYLGLSAQAYDWMESAVRHLSRQIYNAHYFKTEELGLTSDIQKESLIMLTPEEWATTSRNSPSTK